MSLVVEVNGSAIVDAVQPSSVGAQMRADDGDTGFGGFLVDDPSATITTTGHHLVTVEESACSQPRLFTGYLAERDIARSLERGMIAGDDARAHEATCVDLNAVFSFRILQGSGVKRPEETMAVRLAWLLAHESLSPFITDAGLVEYPTRVMDAADYTGGTPRAVLDDLASRLPGSTGDTYTYYAYWDVATQAAALYFGPEDTGIGQSTLSISNDLADINGSTVFAPDAEAKLRRTPEEVYSEVVLEYAHGTKRIYRRREATYTAFGIDRGTTIQRPYTGSATTAQNQADAWLTKHSAERDEITVAIIVPPASAGLAVAGQRIDVKFTHLPGYETWTSMRIVTSTITPHDDTATQYRVELVLVLPMASATTSCNIQEISVTLAGDGSTVQHYANTYDGGPDVVGVDWAASVDLIVGHWYRFYSRMEGSCFPWGDPSGCYEGLSMGSQTYIDRYQAGQFNAGYPDWGFGIVGELDAPYLYYGDVVNEYWANPWPPGRDELPVGTTVTCYLGLSFNIGNVEGTGTVWIEDLGMGDSVGPYVTAPAAQAFPPSCAADTESDEGATPGSPIIPATPADPTVNDDANDGYQVGQLWINTSTGAVFTLTDSTPGAAVWTPMAGTTGTDLGWFVVTEYGAVGDDSTDDTAAIQSAIDAAEAAGGGVVYFPGLTFKITSSLICNTSAANVQFLGSGNQYGPSVIHMTAADSALEFPDDFNTHDTQAPLVRNLRIKGPTTTTPGVYGIYAYADCHLENVGIDGFYQGFRLGSHSYYSRVKGCMFSNNYDSGVYLYGGNNAVIESSRFIGGSTGPTPYGYGAQSHGIVILGSLNTRVVNNSVEQYGSTGILIEGSGPTNDPWGSLATVISGNYFETSVTGALAAIYLGYDDPVSSVLIEGNYIQGGTVTGCWSIDSNYATHATITGNDIGFTAANNNVHGAIRGGANASDFLLLNNRVYSGTVTLPTDSYTLNPDTPPLTSGDTAGGDLGGTYPNPDVTAIDGVAVSGTPTAGDVLTATGAAAATWSAPSAGGGGELLVADGTSGPNGILPSAIAEVSTEQTTTSGTLEDITGASLTVTIQRTCKIAVTMAFSCYTASGAAPSTLGVAVNVDGTDHQELQRYLSGTTDRGIGAVTHLSDALAPGTYTVKGRFRRVSGVATPAIDALSLVAVGMGADGPVMLTNEAQDDYLYGDV